MPEQRVIALHELLEQFLKGALFSQSGKMILSNFITYGKSNVTPCVAEWVVLEAQVELEEKEEQRVVREAQDEGLL